MKKIFSFYCCVLLSIAAWGDTTATVDGIKYILNGSNATVTYPGDKPSDENPSTYTGAITIPETITVDATDYNVTAIGDKAFRGATITSISLPEGLLTIGEEAIYNTQVTELTIPNSVTKLMTYSLAYNSLLTTVTIGENNANRSWGYWVLYRESGPYDNVYMKCNSKPSVPDKDTFDSGYASTIHVKSNLYDDYIKDSYLGGQYKNIVGDIVNGEVISLTNFTADGIKYKMVSADRVAVTYPNANKPGSSNKNEYSGEIVVPSQVTYKGKTYYVRGVADYAFRHASDVTSITLPEGLVFIGEEAIYNSSKITNLTIPNSVRTLRKSALSENSQLNKITFGDNISKHKWGNWVCWRSSGAYDIYMVCDAVPTLAGSDTFDNGKESTIHVKPGLLENFKTADKWKKFSNIVGDITDEYCDLQDAITTSRNIITDEVGTEPGYYSASSTTSLKATIDAADALTTSATTSEISDAIDNMNTAKGELVVNPLTEGYYFIENEDKKQMLYAEATYASSGGLGIQDFNASKTKFYFKLIKKGNNWYMKCMRNNLYAGTPVNGNSVNEYITLTETPEYEQVITWLGVGKYKLQSLYDGTNASYPYSVSGGWVLLSSSENDRTCWRFHPASTNGIYAGILSAEDVEDMVTDAVSSSNTSLDLSEYLLADEVTASDMLADGKNLLVKVAPSSGITGQNIVNDGVCANLVLTDAQLFGYTEDITATTASYSRSISNKFGTICLPYAVSSNENVQYYTLDRKEGSTLYLTKQADIEAGVPAVFENLSEGSTLNATASSVTVKGSVPAAADATLKLIGTFEELVITDAEELAKDYYISGGKFRQATNKLTVNPFRAYFTTTSGNEVKMFNLSFQEEEETGIDNVQRSTFNVQSIFDANGVKLTSLRKGLNIVKTTDGGVQKIMVK